MAKGKERDSKRKGWDWRKRERDENHSFNSLRKKGEKKERRGEERRGEEMKGDERR